MNKIRTLLVDDEPLALQGLKIRLEQFDDLEVVDTASNGREAVKKIRSEKPDLVFLDIQMPGMGGFDVVKALANEELPIIIFATAFDKYAIQAFETHATDYLLKPIEEERLEQAISRVREQISEHIAIEQNAKLIDLIRNMDDPPEIELSEILTADDITTKKQFESQFSIKDRGEITLVSVSSIQWIDAAGDYMCLHTDNKTHILRETMKNMEKRLDPDVFKRIHRSTIVNINMIEKLASSAGGKYLITLKNGSELQASRNYRESLKQFL
ncbi:LytR/AlgR family response regulator transcription factor [Pseudemcibacter aquimaris]|uniref:LytR/AlgR family response regulator transcription factor n=1 Tax=Pseudemcibacter aquimaris TaxID=2857064 RepID=UPI0020121307|nr:response regulator transcription factor [Pseudemcibacter aquimaris]MCC3860237.1 response regulator transcription factor [Pseudemcibacter aquimaris]WDU57562.1 response regulator transcription factor [Pseudemcibacter aquimaris]